MNPIKEYVCYFRVSTDKQGVSGLGLEAQREYCIQYSKGRGQIIQEFTEIESGGRNDREILEMAIQYAKKHGAVLLTARLDRLSRSVEHIFQIRGSGVKFESVDIPDSNTLSVGINAILGQVEREKISERTRAALAAKRERGDVLGNAASLTYEGRSKGQKLGVATRNKRNSAIHTAILTLKSRGLTQSQIWDILPDLGFKSTTGGRISLSVINRWYHRDTEA